MVWKFPSKARAEQSGSPWSEELTNEMIQQVHKRLCQSTYQSDYLGIPQGTASIHGNRSAHHTFSVTPLYSVVTSSLSLHQY